MTSNFLRRAWPKIHAPLARKPMNLSDWNFKEAPTRKRIEKLRSIVFNLVQKERLEISQPQAFEVRPYMDRLIQMAIDVKEFDACDDDAKDLFKFWLMEQENIDKLFNHLVPRFESYVGSYTRMYWLPDLKYQQYQALTMEYGVRFTRKAVVELRGNPYTPVAPKALSNGESLLNVLLREAKKANLKLVLEERLKCIENDSAKTES